MVNPKRECGPDFQHESRGMNKAKYDIDACIHTRIHTFLNPYLSRCLFGSRCLTLFRLLLTANSKQGDLPASSFGSRCSRRIGGSAHRGRSGFRLGGLFGRLSLLLTFLFQCQHFSWILLVSDCDVTAWSSLIFVA